MLTAEIDTRSKRAPSFVAAITLRSLCSSAAICCLCLAASACRQRADPLVAFAGPRDLVRFELKDSRDDPLWAIESLEGRTLRHLDYGLIPVGFRQLIPADGRPPRPLEDGEPLTAETRTRTRVFLHQGYAVGSASFRASSYRMQRIGPSSAGGEP